MANCTYCNEFNFEIELGTKTDIVITAFIFHNT